MAASAGSLGASVSRRRVAAAIQPGARQCSCVQTSTKCLALNLSILHPGCSAPDDVGAALSGCFLLFFLLSMGCQMSKSELPNLCPIIFADLLLAFRASDFPAWLSLWFPQGEPLPAVWMGETKAQKGSDGAGTKQLAWLPAQWDKAGGLMLQLLAPRGCDMGFLALAVLLACLAAFQVCALSCAQITVLLSHSNNEQQEREFQLSQGPWVFSA